MTQNTNHQGGCLFTEADWEVWETISKRQSARELKARISLSPCCQFRLRRLTAQYFDDKGKHKHELTDCYLCSKCKKIFRLSIKLEVMKQ